MPDLKSNPSGLGKITVVTAGQPVSLLANDPTWTGNADNGKDLYANKFTVKAIGTNAGTVYVGLKTMNRSTLADVLMILDPGQPWTFQHDVGMNKYHLGDYWVDADNNGDAVFANCDVV